MIILGIETSCDDTCVAVVKGDGQYIEILGDIVSSQEKIHREWGGIVPRLAKREHSKNLVFVLFQALKKANLLEKKSFKKEKTEKNIKKIKEIEKILGREKDLIGKAKEFLINYQRPKIDLIAVTDQPGLEPCLWVGKNFAQALSFFWDIPIVKIDHLESHIAVALLKPINSKFQILNFKDVFPSIGLIVSGGHTQIVLIKNFTNHQVLGETRDDAAGECFDKTARILGLDYPGGPIIAEKAQEWKEINSKSINLKSQILNSKVNIKLPRPMIYQKNYDFSFSGLKTAVLYHHQSQNKKTQKSLQYIQEMCYHIQQAIIDVLISKTIRAAKQYQVKSIIIGGGVVANQELRKQFLVMIKKQIPNITFLLPELKYSTDNAVMIAVQGYLSCH